MSTALDPLPSWNEGPAKAALSGFVEQVVTVGSPDFVSTDERIAVFDNDGTVWSEKPVYVQLAFTLDRIRDACIRPPQNRKHEQPFQGILEGDLEAALRGRPRAIVAWPRTQG